MEILEKRKKKHFFSPNLSYSKSFFFSEDAYNSNKLLILRIRMLVKMVPDIQ